MFLRYKFHFYQKKDSFSNCAFIINNTISQRNIILLKTIKNPSNKTIE
jgi:hypothetical protein